MKGITGSYIKSEAFQRKLLDFFFNFYLLIYLFLAAASLCCFARALSSCGDWADSVVAVCGLLTVVASLVEHQLWLHLASVVAACGFQNTGSIAVAHEVSCSVACGIFQTRDRVYVLCIGRPILTHRATRQVPAKKFYGDYDSRLPR